MTDYIRWGILSTANIGRKVIPAIQQSRNGRVAAVASRSLERAEAYAAELGIPLAYGSYEALLQDPNIDAIYNPLPNSEHAPWSIRAAEAGKPVLCEKPLATDTAEAQQMVEAFEQRGLLFAEAFMYRFHPQTERVMAMIESGAVGEMQIIEASFTFTVQRENDVRLDQSLAGGGLWDVGCYCVNVMRLMTGEEPDDVRALARFGEQSGVDESLVGLLSFPSGVLGHFDSGLRTSLKHGYEIRGSGGRILVEEGFGIDPTRPTTIRHWQGGRYNEITIPAANHYTLMAEDFADALLNNRPPRFPPQDGVRNMAVLDRLLATARQAG